ncbi:MAG: acyltransferase [Lachnospiraceae bacterium]|nr:acyltransferase [Lachnospiraceae bacterium]
MKLSKQSRLSGIELLKLIAMLLIVISHSAPYYGDVYAESYVNLRVATTNVQNLLLIFFVYLGQVGNCIFLVCSTFFMLEQDKVKGRKVLYLLTDCLFFSLSFLLAFSLMGYQLPRMTILKQFFPTTFEFNWYVGCYLLLYLIHPALNLIIRSLSQKQLLLVNLIGIGLYSIAQMVLRDSFYYTRLVGFILVYFLMAYSKNHLKNTAKKKAWNLAVLTISTLALVGMILVTNVLGQYTDTFYEKMLHYCIFVNPFILLIAFSSFHLCKEWHITNKVINLCASVTLYIYVIHENYLFATYARPTYFAYIYQTYSYTHVALWSLLLALICYVAGLVIGLIYRYTLRILIYKVCDRMTTLLSVICNKTLEIFSRLD